MKNKTNIYIDTYIYDIMNDQKKTLCRYQALKNLLFEVMMVKAAK